MNHDWTRLNFTQKTESKQDQKTLSSLHALVFYYGGMTDYANKKSHFTASFIELSADLINL